MKILMVASENDALPGGKVGGIGDVVRDIPLALAAAGQQVDVVTPGYNVFSKLPGAQPVGSVRVHFSGMEEHVDIYQAPAKKRHKNVTLWVLEHPLFAAGGAGRIYVDDPPERPFATDAGKFALFSAAVARAVTSDVFGTVDVLHLHDWHAAMVAMLRAFDPEYEALQSIHTVYTIHNLSIQGIRPLAGDPSSLQSWFPELDYDQNQLNDPRTSHCINPMRAGINLSDKVHAVSPTYAREILVPSNIDKGYFGGEGLHADLQRAEQEDRLHGILNGCEYPEQTVANSSFRQLCLLCEEEVLKWIGTKPEVENPHLIAISQLERLNARYAAEEKEDQPFIVTSVGRITDQKVRLFRQILQDGKSALDVLLETMGEQGIFVMLGSGDAGLEQFLAEVASRQANFVFLKGYSEVLSDSLYRCGNLFLMPSSFEPCGISQMLAMCFGQPCLVHGVGGLADTVIDCGNGFSFTGDNLQSQAENMICCFESALKIHQEDIKTWQKISSAAAESRFRWSDVADQYLSQLYSK